MIDKAKNIRMNALRKLILKRGWSKNSPYDRRTASRHKKQFLEERCPMNLKDIFAKVLVYTIVAAGALATVIIKQENGLEEHNKKSIRNYHCYFLE